MALPFPTPTVSRGFAALSPEARALGAEAAAAVGSALGQLLGGQVLVSGRPVPAPAEPLRGMVRACLVLEALSARAAIEIEARLLARAAEALAGASPRTPAALGPAGLESALLDLATLAAIDALPAAAESALGTRLAAGAADDLAGADLLVVALDLAVGTERGRARLLLPSRAVAALRGPPSAAHPGAGIALGASLREGSATVDPADLASLERGDVLLLDEGAPAAELLLPGGLALRGRLEGDVLHLQEIRMTESQLAYPITLAVEVARVTVTLGELAGLEPGAALPLDVRRDGAVVLRAGERTIARGQLVEIDGALGVRITELGDHP
jgi:type III secretion protein Q